MEYLTAFLLAATGSAVRLGNIWGFPYKARENGGGLFLLLYIFYCYLLLRLPVFMAEVFIGKKGKSNPVSAIESLADKSKSTRSWNIVGYGGILASLIIAGYYAVIAGFVINYGFLSASGVEVRAAKELWVNEQNQFLGYDSMDSNIYCWVLLCCC
jgi:Na+-dependent transporters of the SNF family